jgi:KDO2-lipid IV(A) lauroyltransferase
MRLLPRPLQMLLGSMIGCLLQHLFRFRKHVIDLQLARVFPDHNTHQMCELRSSVYRHFGRLLVEILSFPRMPRKRLLKYVQWHGLEHLDAALAKGKGVCLLAGHLGSWELPGLAFVALGYDYRAIGKEMKSKAGETFRLMLRDENGVVTIPRRGSIRDILRALKDKAIIAFVLDQNMTSDEGEFVDFFGYPACTMTNLAVIAQRTGAAVVPGYTWRDEKGVHHNVLLPELTLTQIEGDTAASIRQNTQRFSDVLAGMIREHPEQWLWIHKRWRTRPEGEHENPFNYRRR